MKIIKEEGKLSFTEVITIYKQNTKTLQQSQVTLARPLTRYKVNVQKSMEFLHTRNKYKTPKSKSERRGTRTLSCKTTEQV